MKEFIKYFEHKLELYCYRIYWADFPPNVDITCEIVTGHLSYIMLLILGLIGFLLSPFIPPINIDGMGLDNLELRRIVLLFISFCIGYVLIIRPTAKYVEKVFTQESVDRIGAVKPYTKLQNNLTKLYLTFGMLIPLFIFAVLGLLIRDYYWTLPIFQ